MSLHPAFKSYDVRGRIGEDLTEETYYRIGRATAEELAVRSAVTGRDIRLTSEAFQKALIEGLADGGVEAIDIGLCGTEEVYFGTEHFAADAGLMVTASHNPADYNGLKLVGPGARPLSDAQFQAINAHVAGPAPSGKLRTGRIRSENPRDAYVERVLSFVDPAMLSERQVVVTAGNGAAGPTFDTIAQALAAKGAKTRFERLHHSPDGQFPNGIPNPLLPENQPPTRAAVLKTAADMGVAWDGDFDRCFFFDERGDFVEGQYVVALLGAAFAAQLPGARIVHDPRVIWSVLDQVTRAGAQAVASKTGHAFIKAQMRQVDAVYGGEMSAHHYFREFMYCDSGMIPWLLILAYLDRAGKALSDLLEEMRNAFPSSGEQNFRVSDASALMDEIDSIYGPKALHRDTLDGLSLEFENWRLNVRKSNTEPLLRLNVEARGDRGLLAEKLTELTAHINAQ